MICQKYIFQGYRLGVPAASMWYETYFIRTSMLPSFLSPQLALTILKIGKSINFMRACYQRIIGRPLSATKTSLRTVLNNAKQEDAAATSTTEQVITLTLTFNS